MDYAKSLTFMTEDERWLNKLGIGTAVILVSLLLTPILIGIAGFLILAGYCVRLVQNVRDGNPRPLPEWDRWSDDLATGFKLAVVFLVYALPALVFMVPMGLGAVLANVNDNVAIAGASLIACAWCLIAIYAIAITLAQPGIMVAFARNGEIGSGLDFRGVYEWTRARLGHVIVVALVVYAVNAVVPLVAAAAGVVLCIVGLIVTIPLGTLVASLISCHLYGQLARIDAQGFAPPAPAPTMPAPAPTMPAPAPTMPAPAPTMPAPAPTMPAPAPTMPAPAPIMPEPGPQPDSGPQPYDPSL